MKDVPKKRYGKVVTELTRRSYDKIAKFYAKKARDKVARKGVENLLKLMVGKNWNL
jgi:hypothetical protein